MTGLTSILEGVGHYLPERVVTNDDFSKEIDTTDEWIFSRTGIKQRHFAAEGEKTSDLATKAAQRALSQGNVDSSEIDLIIVATVTPDHTFPSTATRVQANLGIKKGFAFDISAACSGYLVALATADQYLRSGQASCALVVGAETFSRIVDMKDRRTCVLFGDGAGAVVLKSANASNEGRGVKSINVKSDGSFYDLLYTDGGPSTTGKSGYIQMQGQEVYKHAVVKLAESALELLEKENLSPDDIDWFIPHQANIRIIEGMAKRLGIANDRIITTVSDHANTSAASIPLALSEAVAQCRVKKGDLILHEAIGGGLIWGAALVRF